MKSNSSIPTWTLIRQITFAKSATSKFFHFNKKACRGIDYSSSFLFLLIGSSKMKVNLLLRLLFPQQMQILTVETHLVVQPNQTQEYFERQTLSRSPIFVLHIVEDYPSLWSTVSFWHRIHQLTTLIWRILITLFFLKKKHFISWKARLYKSPSVGTEWKFWYWLQRGQDCIHYFFNTVKRKDRISSCQ